MAETSKNTKKCLDQKSKRPPITPTGHPSSRKYQKKGVNPVRVSQSELTPDNAYPRSLICENSACRATLSIDDTFCKRCSCCICKLFDDNKDPSLWFVCTSEHDDVDDDSCGLSSHLECALKEGKVGVTGRGQSMNQDGSYCCAWCGKLSLILGCWKKQLMIAMDARRFDELCKRISLSYRLLEGTLKFQEMHRIVEDVMRNLDSELGPEDVSVKMSRRGKIVSRLDIAGEVQEKCALAIEKADEWLAALSITSLHQRDNSLHQRDNSACRFLFEEITSSSVVIVLIEPPAAFCADIKGYKLWYCKSGNETYPKKPCHIFSRSQKKMLISNLQPFTEYSCMVASFSETGDVGLFEAKFFTKSANKSPSSGNKAPTGQRSHPSFMLDLNEASVPDLNEDIPPFFNTDMGEDSRQPMRLAIKSAYEVAPQDNKRMSLRSDGSGVSTNGDIPAVNSREGIRPKRAVTVIEDTNERGSMLNGSPLGASKELGNLDFSFDYCVRVICKLEGDGHVKAEFRKKFLTWFSLRSTEHEKKVVKTFIQCISDPKGLASQLVDTFSGLVNFKKPPNDI